MTTFAGSRIVLDFDASDEHVVLEILGLECRLVSFTVEVRAGRLPSWVSDVRARDEMSGAVLNGTPSTWRAFARQCHGLDEKTVSEHIERAHRQFETP